MKILIPIDFSENASHALKYASLLGQVIHAELMLLHVYTPPVTRGNAVYALVNEEIGRMMHEATAKLQEMSREVNENYGVSCDQLVKMGSPVEEIVSESENSRVDLIVMGTRGASGIEKVLFGSNTASVIEKAFCPVLAVPGKVILALPKKIVFATDFQGSNLDSLAELATVIKGTKAELILLHVAKETSKSDRDLIEYFSKTVSDETKLEQPSYYVMHDENVEKGIDNFVDAIGADLVALSTRKRGVFEGLLEPSLTKKIAYHARLPLLVFHESGKENESKYL
jgi:nucleotide-binding universal stress UspA family protein